MKRLFNVLKWMFFPALLVGYPAYTVFQSTGWFNFDNGYNLMAWGSLIVTALVSLFYNLASDEAETVSAGHHANSDFDEEVDEQRRQFSFRGMGYPHSNINDLDD